MIKMKNYSRICLLVLLALIPQFPESAGNPVLANDHSSSKSLRKNFRNPYTGLESIFGSLDDMNIKDMYHDFGMREDDIEQIFKVIDVNLYRGARGQNEEGPIWNGGSVYTDPTDSKVITTTITRYAHQQVSSLE